ncbi:alpha/beta hydrolase [Subtercola endophyticus]|uniref:alpha/beta hydrolase n=1 Tax=Subtercola endophyticus TaxID=2895559 RepID=UPI001E573BE1|nr:alpha/beta hydrolase [Subtercola endophyticus]UFS60633.1 alpha/beta hydrolase [Subtercola endophyticus]
MTEILFVHGALVRDGAWWWNEVAEQVRDATGVSSRAVLLPSCGEGPAGYDGSGLHEDAAALRDALDGSDSAIVVGHSYGGTVIAQGADHPAVAHLLYITSYLPDVGQSQGDIVGAEPDPVSIAVGDDGTLHVDGYDAASFGARFWHDVADKRVRAEAWQRVTRQSVAAFGTPTTAAAWQGRESTYLVCADDRSTSLALQRFHASRATHAVELPTSHHPFLSRPDLVAEQLQRILASF